MTQFEMKKAVSGPDQISPEKEEFVPVVYAAPNYPFLKVHLASGEIKFDHGAWTARTEQEYKEMENLLNIIPSHRANIQRVDFAKAEEIAKRHMANQQRNRIGQTVTAGLMAEVTSPITQLRQEQEAAHMNIQLQAQKPPAVEVKEGRDIDIDNPPPGFPKPVIPDA